MDSQLLQMADYCAHAAFQSVQDRPNLDEKFRRHYETALVRVIARPFGTEAGRSIRGSDYPSERIRTNIRRTALRHALLSYAFGTLIIATTINLVAGLTK